MVFGGRHNQLRSYEIYPQFEQLTLLNKLETTAAVSIRKTWLKLRKVENIIQLVNDQANHSYPDSAVVLKVISEALGYQDWVHAFKDIEQLREKINQEFQNLLSTKQEKSELTTNQQLIVGQLLNRFSSSRVPQARVEQANQILCIASKQCDDVPVLTHLADLIKNILSRPAYLLMLLKERNLLKKLIKLLCKQEYFAASLKKHPVLLEQLFDYEEFIVFDEVTLSSKWLTQLQADCDVEQWMEATRFFKNAQQFNLMMAWSDGLIDDELACQQLTVLAKFMLSLVIHFSFKETALKFNEIALSPDQLIVIAYGSAAVGTMHIDSDLDLVFVLDIQPISGSERVFAQKWIRRIIHHLNSQMYNGKLYDLDMQLRPNGNSGALITTCSEFASYQEQEAWLWEHAAMVKSKPVFASKKQQEWHQEIRKQVLTQKRSYREVDEALDKMASKLSKTKKTSGHQGEFEIMSCVLKHAATNPEIVEHHALGLIRQKLIELNIVSADQINLLAQKKGPIR